MKIVQVYTQYKDNYSGDELFLQILKTISPKDPMPYQAATITLMAKYFESCDIFEEPK